MYTNMYYVTSHKKNYNYATNFFKVDKNNKTNWNNLQINVAKCCTSEDIVTFGSINHFKAGFNKYDLRFIDEILAKTRYGIDFDAIFKDDRFEINAYKEKIQLKNLLSFVNSTDKIIGLCGELTYKVGKKLEEQLGEKYNFCAIRNLRHVYLASWSRKNDEKVRACIDKINSNPPKFGIFSEEPYITFRNLPEELLIIDPSSKKVGISSDECFENYTIWKFQTLKEMDPYTHDDIGYMIDYTPCDSKLCVGMAHDLFPKDFLGSISEDYIATFKFRKNNDKTGIDIEVKLDNGSRILYNISPEEIKENCKYLSDAIQKIKAKTNILFDRNIL